MFAAVIAEHRALVLEQDLAKSVDAPEWGAQVMRDGVRERAELFVERAQLGDALLELAVEAMHLFEETTVLEHNAGLVRKQLQQREIVVEEGGTSRHDDGDDPDPTLSDGDRRRQHMARARLSILRR